MNTPSTDHIPTTNTASLPIVLSRLPLDGAWINEMKTRYVIIPWNDANANERQHARAVVTNGSTGLSDEEQAALPALELIVSFGAGYERIDLQAAKRNAIQVCHSPDANVQSVADHAFSLMLSLARGIPELDRGVKLGKWEELRAPRPSVRGKTLGIVGLGNIGHRLATLASSMGMSIAYLHHRRTPAEPYTPYHHIIELAAACDVLALTCPGGPRTQHLVNKDVLDALGPTGLLINVSRGSVVDTAALISALREGSIAGAALDVIENEPLIPDPLRTMDQVILTPHLAGRSPETYIAQHTELAHNLDGWFKNGEPKHPVAVPAT